MGEWIEHHVEWIAGLVGSLILGVAGMATYIAKIQQRSKSNSLRLDSIEGNMKEMGKDINDIENAQIRTDEKIEMILKNQDVMIELMKQK